MENGTGAGLRARLDAMSNINTSMFNGSTAVQNKNDSFSDCQEKFQNHKPAFLSLLESHIDIDEFIPIPFRNHFYASTGRTRKYPLYALLWALIIQRIFSIPTDQLLLTFLAYSKPLRGFCGFHRVLINLMILIKLPTAPCFPAFLLIPDPD